MSVPQTVLNLRQENILLKEGFFHTYDYEGATIEYKLPVYDAKGNKTKFSDVVRGKSSIVLFASMGAGSCRDCVFNNIEFIKKQKDINAVICIEGLSQKEFEIFAYQQGIEDIAYLVNRYMFTKLDINPVVYFVIDNDFVCKYFYAPSVHFPELVKDYLSVVKHRISFSKTSW